MCVCVSTWSAIVAKKTLEQNLNPPNLCANIVHNFGTDTRRYRHANDRFIAKPTQKRGDPGTQNI